MLLNEKEIFDCNSAALELFGYGSRKKFCAKHPGELAPLIQPDGRDSMDFANNNIAIAMNKGNYRFEHVHRRTDGTEFPAEVLLTCIEMKGRKILQAVVRDITERKRAEKELERYAEDMRFAKDQEEDNAGQLVELLHELEITKAEAEEATRAKSEFAPRANFWPI
jgi:PAS domain S-box-containing protein